MPAETFRLDRLKTPIGVALLVTDDDGVLRALDWEDYEVRIRQLLRLQCGAVELKEARAPAEVKTELSGYFKGVGGDVVDEDNWFGTGDVATIDADGYVQLTDRLKDVIKSGGEWISSIEIENLAVSHPDVFEAAVIAIPHPTWQERPLLLVQPKPGTHPTKESILDFLSTRIAKWWMPDDVIFVESLPHTATGKLLKTELRKKYGGQLAVAG